MKFVIGVFSLILVVSSCFWFIFKREYTCDSLAQDIKDQNIYYAVTGWVDSNVSQRADFRSVVELTNSGAGLYNLKLPFDWSVLGFSERTAGVQLIGSDESYRAMRNFSAAYFHGRERAGIIVLCKDDPSGRDGDLPPDVARYIVARNGRLLVYCHMDE